MKKFCLIFTIFACFFIFYLQPSAATEYYVQYDYNDSYVVNNHNRDFFGENGYLERLRNDLSTTPQFSTNGYSIFFTKNDIYVFYRVSPYSQFMSFIFTSSDEANVQYDPGTGNLSTAYYFKLSDSNYNFNEFIYNVTHYNSYHLTPNRYYSYIGYQDSSDLKYTNFNYYDNFTDYFIPYYSSYEIKSFIRTGSSTYYQDLNINDYSDIVPTYFDLFSHNEPTINLQVNTTYVYNNAFIIDSAYVDENIGGFSFKVPSGTSSPNVSDVQIYGLVNDNGLYHYELLDSSIINLEVWELNHRISDYCNFNNYTWSCSINIAEFQHSDLSAYERIYVKFNYDNPVPMLKETFHYTSGSPWTYQIIVNDVCSDCMYLQLASSGQNTYTFTNSDSSQVTNFYYNNVIQNGVLYNSPKYIDLVSKKELNDLVTYSTHNYVYGNFNKLLDNNIKGNTGLIMNMYIDDLSVIPNISGSFQVLYFISPNLYWGVSVYSSDRTYVNCSGLDENGDRVDFTIVGDYTNPFADYHISNMFNTAVTGSSGFISSAIELLSLSTSFYALLPLSVRYVLILFFMFGALILFIKSIM